MRDFVIAGEGELMESLRELAVQLGIQDDVFFIGRCDNVADLLFASDVGVLSSKSRRLRECDSGIHGCRSAGSRD